MAYTLSLQTAGRRRVSPVTTQDRFPQAAARGTPVVRPRPSASTGGGRISGVLDASSKGGDWRTTQAGMPSPGVSPLGPFSGPSRGAALAAYLCRKRAEFEQGVLNEYGLAQVGFGIKITSFQASPFLHKACSVADSIPNRCGSRAPSGRFL